MYIHTILANANTSEPFVAAMGGPPVGLLSKMEGDLRLLERLRIKPVFVLSGLTPATKIKPFMLEDPRVSLRSQAWEYYDEGNTDRMQELLLQSASVDVTDLIRSVLRQFRHRNVEFIVAPYLAGGQVSSWSL